MSAQGRPEGESRSADGPVHSADDGPVSQLGRPERGYGSVQHKDSLPGPRPRVLIVDDTPQNIKLLVTILAAADCETLTASSGAEALAIIASERPDLVLLDVVMPGMDGYQVCRAIRADPSTEVLPVVMVTALDPAMERIRGLEAGADDFLTKPVHHAELLARVRSLLRIQSLYGQVQQQARELAAWNATLEARVQEQVGELDRLSRLKRFLSPRVVDLIVAGQLDDPLATRRREVTVLFVDLRGFTSFTETADPEEVFEVLRSYHGEVGRLIQTYEGTIEHFAGDGIMVVFNDPLPLPDPAYSAVRLALAIREKVDALARSWRDRGFDLGCAFGIAQGYATIGTIGFAGRFDYGTIGKVTNLAARLCAEARNGEILVPRRVLAGMEDRILAESVGERRLAGFQAPVSAFNVIAPRDNP